MANRDRRGKKILRSGPRRENQQAVRIPLFDTPGAVGAKRNEDVQARDVYFERCSVDAQAVDAQGRITEPHTAAAVKRRRQVSGSCFVSQAVLGHSSFETTKGCVVLNGVHFDPCSDMGGVEIVDQIASQRVTLRRRAARLPPPPQHGRNHGRKDGRFGGSLHGRKKSA